MQTGRVPENGAVLSAFFMQNSIIYKRKRQIENDKSKTTDKHSVCGVIFRPSKKAKNEKSIKVRKSQKILSEPP